LGGQQTVLSATGLPPSVTLDGPTRSASAYQVLSRYVGLGLEHILQGVDHLLFLLGLLLLVSGPKGLLLTVSAFTVAHSLTLAAASLGVVEVPTGPVEICIALSLLLLAVETTRSSATATRRWPWLVAFAFGLLHGLGFASALAGVGLPEHAVLLALVGFNLGVELGQVAVVGVFTLGSLLMKSRPRARGLLAGAATWLLGSCSVYWVLQRGEAWLSGLGSLSF
jgi:hypothetical protein